MCSKLVKASELKAGDQIKLSPRHRKVHWIQKIITLDASVGKIPKEMDGMLLLVLWSCKQIQISPDKEIFLVYSPKTEEVQDV